MCFIDVLSHSLNMQVPLRVHVHGFTPAFTARKLISAACMQTGTDQFSNELAQQLRASGCQLDLLKQVEGPTGTAVIMLQPDGMRLCLPRHVFAVF